MELDGVEVDHCLECLGTWLDTGEIEAIASRAGADSQPITRGLMLARRGQRTTRRCPRCRRRLVEIHIDRSPPLTVDRCPIGHGVWFDCGEMKTLIHAYAESAAAPVAAFFADLYRSELKALSEGVDA